MFKYVKYLAVLPLLALSSWAVAEYTEEDVRNSFYPYENWTPEFPGYTPRHGHRPEQRGSVPGYSRPGLV